jgi:predicted TIM-barrel fold metal-dependent hydrolase
VDIVDAQVHINKVGISSSIEAMNALGIAAALFHEHGGRDADQNPLPHQRLESGFVRPNGSLGEVAARRYPDRLSYLWQVDPRDPDLDAVVRLTRASPQARALRMCMVTEPEVALLASGRCDPAFAVAEKYDLPLFLLVIRRAPLLQQYFERWTGPTLVIDHCGLPTSPEGFAEVLAFARFPNVHLKWSHPVMSFPTGGHPFREFDPYLRAAVDAFGARRIMWASDFTEVRGGYSWGEMLFYLRDTPVLSASEKEWILGRTARTVLRWPQA